MENYTFLIILLIILGTMIFSYAIQSGLGIGVRDLTWILTPILGMAVFIILQLEDKKVLKNIKFNFFDTLWFPLVILVAIFNLLMGCILFILSVAYICWSKWKKQKIAKIRT